MFYKIINIIKQKCRLCTKFLYDSKEKDLNIADKTIKHHEMHKKFNANKKIESKNEQNTTAKQNHNKHSQDQKNQQNTTAGKQNATHKNNNK